MCERIIFSQDHHSDSSLRKYGSTHIVWQEGDKAKQGSGEKFKRTTFSFAQHYDRGKQ
jgi:hypothetical protein